MRKGAGGWDGFMEGWWRRQSTRGSRGRREELVVSTGQHDSGIVLHEMVGLEVEVAEHSVGFPPAE